MKTRMDELKGCPKCKSYNITIEIGGDYCAHATKYEVQCGTCGIRTKTHLDKKSAIIDWNRRNEQAEWPFTI